MQNKQFENVKIPSSKNLLEGLGGRLVLVRVIGEERVLVSQGCLGYTCTREVNWKLVVPIASLI